MNSSIIRIILGQVLKFESIFLLFPVLVDLIYQEQVGRYYLLVAAACALIGFLMTHRRPFSHVFYLKEGCIATAASWILLSFFGSLPLWISGEIPAFTDALFETVSGFTTTGASILNDVEALSHAALFWRCFTHLIGGMGVLVFLLAVIPLGGGSNFNLMRAESPGPSVGKLVPTVKTTARILYSIYLFMTVAEIVCLLLSGLPLFDSVCTGFSTAGTGGFGIYNDSLGSFTMAQQWIVTVFMILFGVNFNAYYLILYRHVRKALSMEEIRTYFAIITVAAIVIFASIFKTSAGIGDALTQAVFQVASIISSTGFSTADFNQWPEVCRSVLVLLMFVGACAGSTGGGIKVSRLLVGVKTMRKEISSYAHPRNIKIIKIDDKPVEHEVVRSVNVYFITFLLTYAASMLLISLDSNDFTTNFTAIIATVNNMGPGLELVGPASNFSFFSNFSKFVLMFDMLAGRLELFPLLILFHPAMLKDLITKRSKRIKELRRR